MRAKGVLRFENAELPHVCAEEPRTFALLKRWRMGMSEEETLTDPLNRWLYLYRQQEQTV